MFEWFKHFRDRKEGVKDEPYLGQPSASRIPDNIEEVQQMIVDNRRLSLGMIAEELKISKGRVSTIVHKHLGKQKICAWFVLHMLTNDQKQTQIETSGDFIDMCDQNLQFLETIITEDETWCCQYDPETK